MKGLLFGGCSFTWGHGLWYYSDLEYTGYPQIDVIHISDGHKRFKDTLSFPNLVANHYKTFFVTKQVTGGSEDETFDFFDHIFHNTTSNRFYTNERYSYEEIEHIFIQLSQVHRNKFYFTLDGKVEECVLWYSHNGYNLEKFETWSSNNNLSLEDCIEIHVENQLDRLKRRISFYESVGIKTSLLIWDRYYEQKLISDPYLDSKLIRFMGKYNTIDGLMSWEKNMSIDNDYEYFINPPSDGHPSKKCHRVIADSIIDSIGQKEQKIIPVRLFESSKKNTILELPDNLGVKIMPEKL